MVHAFTQFVRRIALRVGLTAVLGVFLAGIIVPVHRDGYNCGPAVRTHSGEAVVYAASSDGSGYRNVVQDCHNGFRYRALVLGASGTLGAALALHGISSVSSRRRREPVYA